MTRYLLIGLLNFLKIIIVVAVVFVVAIVVPVVFVTMINLTVDLFLPEVRNQCKNLLLLLPTRKKWVYSKYVDWVANTCRWLKAWK